MPCTKPKKRAAISIIFILIDINSPPMYQLLILIPLNVNVNSFDEGWPDFLEAAEEMEGLIRESVSIIERSIYGQNNIRRIYSFLFRDRSSFEKSLLSPPGEKAGKIIHEITGGDVILLSGPFQEDSLERIQSWEETDEHS